MVRGNLITLCGLAVLLGGAYLQGQLIGRWQPLPAALSVDLASIPRELGEWKGSDFTLAPQALEIGAIDSYLAREYVHQTTGEVVTVMILAGPGGPISVHPPEVCFSGQGFQKQSQSKAVSVKDVERGEQHGFEWAGFRRSAPGQEGTLQLLWGWTTSGIWSAPPNPRLAFARSRRLYKIYMVQNVGDSGRGDAEPALALATLLVPQLRGLLQQPATDGVPSEKVEHDTRSSARAEPSRQDVLEGSRSTEGSIAHGGCRLRRVDGVPQEPRGQLTSRRDSDTDWGVG